MGRCFGRRVEIRPVRKMPPPSPCGQPQLNRVDQLPTYKCTACGTALPELPPPTCPGCNRRLIHNPQAPTSVFARRVSPALAGSVLLAVTLGTCFACVASSVKQQQAERAAGNKTAGEILGAWVACERYVGERLLAPGPYRFPREEYFVHTSRLAADSASIGGSVRYRVRGYVDTQSATPGTLRRKPFVCDVHQDEETWAFDWVEIVNNVE